MTRTGSTLDEAPSMADSPADMGAGGRGQTVTVQYG